MRQTLFAALLTSCSILAFASPAIACKCKDVDASDAYERAKVVFYGEAIKAADDEVTFKVSKAYKKTKRKRKVKVVQTGSNCDVDFEIGKKYVVYASKEGKELHAGLCSMTRQLDFTPLYGVAWTLADRPQYGLTKKQLKSIENTRRKLTDAALSRLKKTVGKCDKGIWKSKKNVKGYVEVRFDHTEGRFFSAEVLKYETSDEASDDVSECIAEGLKESKFPKFGGGPISVHAYLLLDQIDPMMARKKASAQVVEHKAEDFN